MRTYCIAQGTLFSDKEGIYKYIWLIHVAVHQKLTEHCKATILR